LHLQAASPRLSRRPYLAPRRFMESLSRRRKTLARCLGLPWQSCFPSWNAAPHNPAQGQCIFSLREKKRQTGFPNPPAHWLDCWRPATTHHDSEREKDHRLRREAARLAPRKPATAHHGSSRNEYHRRLRREAARLAPRKPAGAHHGSFTNEYHRRLRREAARFAPRKPAGAHHGSFSNEYHRRLRREAARFAAKKPAAAHHGFIKK